MHLPMCSYDRNRAIMKKRFLLVATVSLCLHGSMVGQTANVPLLLASGEASGLSAPATTEGVSTAPADPEDVDHLLTSLIPHPYLYFGPSLMGGGYAPVAYRAETGINVESRRWVMKALAAYDDGRKVDDADQPNANGHDRYLDGGIYFRLPWLPAFLGEPSHWFLGAGYRWSQLSTTNYTKGNNRPQIGGGRDVTFRQCSECRREFSMRVGLDWVMTGNDWQNGSHGPEVTLTFPTPRENRHWFVQERVATYRFHETVTAPNDRILTQQQDSEKGIDSFEDIGVLYRF